MVGGRWPLLEDDLRWKMTFSGRWPLVEDNLEMKITFIGGWPLVEDNLRWKTTFGRRRLSVEDDLWWKTKFGGSLHLLRFTAFFRTDLKKFLSFNCTPSQALLRKKTDLPVSCTISSVRYQNFIYHTVLQISNYWSEAILYSKWTGRPPLSSNIRTIFVGYILPEV